MSTLAVEVVRLGALEKHPNADSLSLTTVFGYPVICRTEDYVPGQLVAYLPIDSVVPNDRPEFAFLNDERRIKARRLRGIFSMGLVIPAPEGAQEGDDVTELLGVTKYEPPEPEDVTALPNTPFLPQYTKIEHYLRYPEWIAEGELVWLTEKIHGCNFRCSMGVDGTFRVGSHSTVRRPEGNSLWSRVARDNDLATLCEGHPGVVFYGEVYGHGVQDMVYGCEAGTVKVRFFDAFRLPGNGDRGGFVDFGDLVELVGRGADWVVPAECGGPVPMPSRDDLLAMLDGPTAVSGDHFREGFVIRPLHERETPEFDRVILKALSPSYLLRKGGTEFH